MDSPATVAPAALLPELELIPVPWGLGGPDDGPGAGPDDLARAGLLPRLRQAGRAARWSPAVVAAPTSRSDEAARWQALAGLCRQLGERTEDSRRQGRFPLVLGGDHAIAAGTWPGLARSVDGPFGLLWLDAHLDAHTRQDSASANPHGMPVALLLGDGDPPLARPVVSPRHLCLVGARSWELPERVRLERYGVTVFGQEDIERQGLDAVLAQALTVVSGAAGFGISLDIDLLDPREAAAVSAPAPGGIAARDWLRALRGLARRPGCVGLELVECDGRRDRDGATAALAVDLAVSLLAPEEGISVP